MAAATTASELTERELYRRNAEIAVVLTSRGTWSVRATKRDPGARTTSFAETGLAGWYVPDAVENALLWLSTA